VLDAGSDLAVDSTTVDVAAGVGAGFLSKFFEDDEQAGLAAEAFEGGSLLFILETARKGIIDAYRGWRDFSQLFFEHRGKPLASRWVWKL
jgi:hypothetical protein